MWRGDAVVKGDALGFEPFQTDQCIQTVGETGHNVGRKVIKSPRNLQRDDYTSEDSEVRVLGRLHMGVRGRRERVRVGQVEDGPQEGVGDDVE